MSAHLPSAHAEADKEEVWLLSQTKGKFTLCITHYHVARGCEFLSLGWLTGLTMTLGMTLFTNISHPASVSPPRCVEVSSLRCQTALSASTEPIFLQHHGNSIWQPWSPWASSPVTTLSGGPGRWGHAAATLMGLLPFCFNIQSFRYAKAFIVKSMILAELNMDVTSTVKNTVSDEYLHQLSEELC